jgi:hypothetical protein
MSAFDHVVLLLSFVYALALTHLLSRIGTLMLARGRVRFSGLLALGMVNAIGLVFSNWLSLWDTRGLKTWSLLSITTQFLFAISIYFVCALAAPDASNERTIDMEAFYWHNRRPFYLMALTLVILAMFANVAFLGTPNPALFVSENVASLIFLVPVVLALAVKARWAQWLAGTGLLACITSFSVLFESRIG